MMTEIETSAEVLDSLKGHAIVGWQPGEGGMHFELDDKRVLIFAAHGGMLVIAVYVEAPSVH